MNHQSVLVLGFYLLGAIAVAIKLHEEDSLEKTEESLNDLMKDSSNKGLFILLILVWPIMIGVVAIQYFEEGLNWITGKIGKRFTIKASRLVYTLNNIKLWKR